MKRIAYIAYWNDSPASGVFKKIRTQASAWRALQGLEVGLFILTRNERLYASKDEHEQIFYFQGGIVERMHALQRLIDAVRSSTPDVIYLRFMPFLPPLGDLHEIAPVVLEVNSDDRTEATGWARRLINEIGRRQLLRMSSGVVFVSEQISTRTYFQKFCRRAIVIGNSIDLSRFPSPTPRPNDGRIRFVFLGSPGQRWHGVDQLLLLAQHRPAWHFHVFGYSETDVPGPVPPNVTLHGFQPISEYIFTASNCDFGVGCLALYRKKVDEISPLKVREYLALGLPVIQTGVDTDFIDGSDFILSLPNTGEIVQHISQIDDFVQRWLGKRVRRDQILHLDVSQKERRRLAFFEEVCLASAAGGPSSAGPARGRFT